MGWNGWHTEGFGLDAMTARENPALTSGSGWMQCRTVMFM